MFLFLPQNLIFLGSCLYFLNMSMGVLVYTGWAKINGHSVQVILPQYSKYSVWLFILHKNNKYCGPIFVIFAQNNPPPISIFLYKGKKHEYLCPVILL